MTKEKKKEVKDKILTEDLLRHRLEVEYKNGQLHFDDLDGSEADKRKEFLRSQLATKPPTKEEIRMLEKNWNGLPSWYKNLNPFIMRKSPSGIRLVNQQGVQIGTYEIKVNGNARRGVPDAREGSEEMSSMMRDCSLEVILSLKDPSSKAIGRRFLEKFHYKTKDLQDSYNIQAKVKLGKLKPLVYSVLL